MKKEMTCEPGKWIPCALQYHKEGSLHRMLHVPKNEKIPIALLQKVKKAKMGGEIHNNGYRIPITLKLKRRANLVKTLDRFT